MEVIVLVGERRAAAEAAKTLGWSTLVVDVPSRPEQAQYAFGGRFREALQWVTERLGQGVVPSAVIGVAEGSVVTAAALRQHFGLPGMPPSAARLAHDKLAMKRAVAAAGIPCAPWEEVTSETVAEELVAHLGLPLVLKLPISSGGRGVRVLPDVESVRRSLAPGLLAEGFIQGTEMSVESFLLRGRTLLRNQTRYLIPGWSSIVPADLDPAESGAVDRLTDDVHRALQLQDGMTHMELFLTASGPVFGEIAARPPGGRLMNLLALAYDFHPWEALIEIGLGRDPGLPVGAARFAGVQVFFPQPGRIRAIHGMELAREVPGVVEVKCHAKLGEIAGPRLGTGQIKAHVLVTDATMTGCEERLRRAAKRISFEMQPGVDGDAPTL